MNLQAIPHPEIEEWYELHVDDPSQRTRKKERLYKALKKSQAVRELWQCPALRKTLIRYNNYEELSMYKARLYNQCLRTLLDRWDLSRFLVGTDVAEVINSERKRDILRIVAADMRSNFEMSGKYIIAESRLQEIIVDQLEIEGIKNAIQMSESMIKDLRKRFQDGVLIWAGEGFYTFIHLRFFEYFHAVYWVWLFDRRDLSFEDLKNEVFGKHCQDERWHGTLLLIAGLVYESFTEKIIDYLIAHYDESGKVDSLFLATDCLVEVKWRYPIREISDHLYDRLNELAHSKSHPPEIRQKAVASIIDVMKDDPDDLIWRSGWSVK